MRIGLDGRWYNYSGVGNYVSELLQAMSDLDEDLEIILYEDRRNPLDHVHGGRIHRVPVHAPRYSVQEQFELPRRCRADQLDVFHSPFYVTPWLAPCPVVVTIHDLIPFLFRIYPGPKRKLIQAGYWLGVKKSARLIADSESTGADLHRILKVPTERIRVIHLATSREYFHPERDAGEAEYLFTHYGVHKPYVLTLSAKNWRTKNLPVVLEALSICRRQVESEFQVVVAGPPDGFREAAQQSAPQIEGVVLTGFVPTPDLAKLYRAAEVFLICSKYEGFGLPLLEAMSCGCAVVSSDAGSLPEVAGPGAILVRPEDSLGMAQAVARLLRNPDERRQQRARSKKRAADFSWEAAARQTFSVYSEVAARR
jgi:glycosyltransferase involved in cell wall biosynthesis